jgi:elongation factor 1-alpha
MLDDIVVMVPCKPMCVEPFVDYLTLGMFPMRGMKQLNCCWWQEKGVEKGDGSAGKVTKAEQKAAKK